MHGYRWLFVVGGLVGISLLAFMWNDRAATGDTALALARQAAIQGLNETARMLVADSSNWATNPEKYAFLNASLGDVQYSTKVAAPYRVGPLHNGCLRDTVDVVSTAAFETGELHRIEATYVRQCGGDGGIRLVSLAER